jgi:hypothetical protein
MSQNVPKCPAGFAGHGTSFSIQPISTSAFLAQMAQMAQNGTKTRPLCHYFAKTAPIRFSPFKIKAEVSTG